TSTRFYQGAKERSPTVVPIERQLREMTVRSKLTLREIMGIVRSPRVSGDQNGYGQLAHLRSGLTQTDLNIIWVAATGSITTPFVPYWIGTQQVLPEYGKHRYLSAARPSFTSRPLRSRPPGDRTRPHVPGTGSTRLGVFPAAIPGSRFRPFFYG